MIMDVASADVLTIYRALVGIVNPRPIAWVTTLDTHGGVNLAPFSFFNAFSANPPIIVFSPTLHRDGSKKDTLCNLELIPEFVLNAAVEDLAGPMNTTSKELPLGQSEAAYATLQPLASVAMITARAYNSSRGSGPDVKHHCALRSAATVVR
jgi:flavin reductase (DIM6/NTAB) family NADH-FMN oxidoreductase RutF